MVWRSPGSAYGINGTPDVHQRHWTRGARGDTAKEDRRPVISVDLNARVLLGVLVCLEQ